MTTLAHISAWQSSKHIDHRSFNFVNVDDDDACDRSTDCRRAIVMERSDMRTGGEGTRGEEEEKGQKGQQDEKGIPECVRQTSGHVRAYAESALKRLLKASSQQQNSKEIVEKTKKSQKAFSISSKLLEPRKSRMNNVRAPQSNDNGNSR